MRQRLPFVDVFMPPSDPAQMVSFLKERLDESDVLELEAAARQERDSLQDGELVLPMHERGQLVSAHVPIVYGCSHACTFCIIPFRRGVERSRRVGEIVAQVPEPGGARCQGSDAAGADSRSLRQRHS